jgi:hypothetical protein
MSELKVNKISSTSVNKELIVNSGIAVGQTGETYFEVLDTGEIKVNNTFFVGSPTGNTHGDDSQLLVSNGPTEPPYWKTFRFDCPAVSNNIPANSITYYFLEGFYACELSYGAPCPGATITTLPEPPDGWLWCDGTNDTPNLVYAISQCNCGTDPDAFAQTGDSRVWSFIPMIKL